MDLVQNIHRHGMAEVSVRLSEWELLELSEMRLA